MRRALQAMTDRLVSSTAELEHDIKFERTSQRAHDLKVLIDKLHVEAEDLEDLLEETKEDIGEQEALIKAIDEEYTAALTTNDTEMMSQYVQEGVPQVMETEELKGRLAERKFQENQKLEELHTQFVSVRTKFYNCEDTIEVQCSLFAFHVTFLYSFLFLGDC